MMKNKKDPKWISQADRIYGGFLYLFPSAHRKEFGPWMRQAFRDRCREVARGEQSLLRVLMAEIVPDLLLGAGIEHMTSNFGELNRKHMAALTLLGCLSVWALFHETVNHKLFDLADAGAKQVDSLKWKYRVRQRITGIQEMADWLVKEDGSPKAKALAANLYLVLHEHVDAPFLEREHDGLCEFQKQATNLVAQVMMEHPDLRTTAYAELACDEKSGCDRPSMVKRLTDQDPQNAYVWLRALRIAQVTENSIDERFAIKGLAASQYIDNHQKNLEIDFSGFLKKYSPDDSALLDSFDSISLNQYPSIFFLARSSCRTLSTTSMDQELVNDCRQAAMVFAQSDDLTTANVTSRLLYRLSADGADRKSAYKSFRNSRWWSDAYHSEADFPGNQKSWAAWGEKWRGKRESISAIQADLASRGMPIIAPDDYELSDYDKKQFGLIDTDLEAGVAEDLAGQDYLQPL